MVLGRLSQGIVILVDLSRYPSSYRHSRRRFGSIAGHQRCGNWFRLPLLQNFLAGILILLAEPFRHDQIVFKEFEGTVENIQTRATIRTYDGRRIVIPNSELFTNSVTVNTAFENRRLYDVGIGYGDDIDLAKQLMLEIHSVNGVLKDPAPDVLVVELAESSVNIRARWWINPPRRADALDARDKVICD